MSEKKSYYNQKKNVYVQEYIREKYDQISIRLKKDGRITRKAIAEAAENAKIKSVNEYVLSAVEEKMIRQGVLLPESAENPSKNEKKEEKARKSEKTQENT